MTSAGERLTGIFLKINSDSYFRQEEKLQTHTEKLFFGNRLSILQLISNFSRMTHCTYCTVPDFTVTEDEKG